MGRTRYGVRDEIRDAIESLYRAISHKSLRGIESVWSHETYTSLAGRKGELRQGWDQIRRYWEQRFQQRDGMTISTRLTGMTCHAVGDVAWLSGTEIRTISDGEQTRQERLRMTSVMERKGTAWQIVSYHVSTPQEEEMVLAPAS